MGHFIKTDRDGAILTITLDRPEVLNSLHAPACHELSAVWDKFVADDSLWAAIITGTGERAFCAGHDLRDGFFDPMPQTGWAGMSHRSDITKPVIAAVNGIAFGGGWEIALASDIIIADERARFALPEPKVGFAALGGGAHRLPLRMPHHLAMGLLLTGRQIDAHEAHRWGVVNEVAAHGTVLDVARRWADDVLACSPLAVRATKIVAGNATQPPALRGAVIVEEIALGERLALANDTREGLAAFAEKRKPVWSGT